MLHFFWLTNEHSCSMFISADGTWLLIFVDFNWVFLICWQHNYIAIYISWPHLTKKIRLKLIYLSNMLLSAWSILNQGLYNRWIGPRRVTLRPFWPVCQMKDGGREWKWTGRFVSKAHAESRGDGGGGGVSWGLKEAGNSLSRNFSYRAVGPPHGVHYTILS